MKNFEWIAWGTIAGKFRINRNLGFPAANQPAGQAYAKSELSKSPAWAAAFAAGDATVKVLPA